MHTPAEQTPAPTDPLAGHAANELAAQLLFWVCMRNKPSHMQSQVEKSTPAQTHEHGHNQQENIQQQHR